MNRQLIDENLSSVERLQYQMAIQNGNQARVKDLNTLASERYQKKIASNANAAIPEVTVNPLPVEIAITLPKNITRSSQKADIILGIKAYWPELADLIDVAGTLKPNLYQAYIFVKSVDNNSITVQEVAQKQELGLKLKENK